MAGHVQVRINGKQMRHVLKCDVKRHGSRKVDTAKIVLPRHVPVEIDSDVYVEIDRISSIDQLVAVNIRQFINDYDIKPSNTVHINAISGGGTITNSGSRDGEWFVSFLSMFGILPRNKRVAPTPTLLNVMHESSGAPPLTIFVNSSPGVRDGSNVPGDTSFVTV